jgi:adenosine deaminase
MTASAALDLASRIPKAELHLHIEGSLEPELLFDLAARNKIDLPFATVEELRQAYNFSDLQSFLDIYYQGAEVLRTEQDFYDLMYAYLERAAADNVRRAEVFFDPQTHTQRGVGFEVFMPGFLAAAAAGERDLGVSTGLIMCFLRHLSGDEAVATFEEAADYHDALLGVGLDSSEVGNPPEGFVRAFELADEAGLHRVAHAGEEGPPAYIWGALDVLGVERIDHGVRADEDDVLVQRLAKDQIPLTVCPLSNLALRVVDDLANHNIKRLADRGLTVTINSDDPAYFGGYIGENYRQTAAALDLSDADVAAMARSSFIGSFAPASDIARWLSEINDMSENET